MANQGASTMRAANSTTTVPGVSSLNLSASHHPLDTANIPPFPPSAALASQLAGAAVLGSKPPQLFPFPQHNPHILVKKSRWCNIHVTIAHEVARHLELVKKTGVSRPSTSSASFGQKLVNSTPASAALQAYQQPGAAGGRTDPLQAISQRNNAVLSGRQDVLSTQQLIENNNAAQKCSASARPSTSFALPQQNTNPATMQQPSGKPQSANSMAQLQHQQQQQNQFQSFLQQHAMLQQQSNAGAAASNAGLMRGILSKNPFVNNPHLVQHSGVNLGHLSSPATSSASTSSRLLSEKATPNSLQLQQQHQKTPTGPGFAQQNSASTSAQFPGLALQAHLQQIAASALQQQQQQHQLSALGFPVAPAQFAGLSSGSLTSGTSAQAAAAALSQQQQQLTQQNQVGAMAQILAQFGCALPPTQQGSLVGGQGLPGLSFAQNLATSLQSQQQAGISNFNGLAPGHFNQPDFLQSALLQSALLQQQQQQIDTKPNTAALDLMRHQQQQAFEQQQLIERLTSSQGGSGASIPLQQLSGLVANSIDHELLMRQRLFAQLPSASSDSVAMYNNLTSSFSSASAQLPSVTLSSNSVAPIAPSTTSTTFSASSLPSSVAKPNAPPPLLNGVAGVDALLELGRQQNALNVQPAQQQQSSNVSGALFNQAALLLGGLGSVDHNAMMSRLYNAGGGKLQTPPSSSVLHLQHQQQQQQRQATLGANASSTMNIANGTPIKKEN